MMMEELNSSLLQVKIHHPTFKSSTFTNNKLDPNLESNSQQPISKFIQTSIYKQTSTSLLNREFHPIPLENNSHPPIQALWLTIHKKQKTKLRNENEPNWNHHTSNKIRAPEVLFDGFHNPITRNGSRSISTGDIELAVRSPGLRWRTEEGSGDPEQLGSVPRQLEHCVVGLGVVSVGRRRWAPRIALEITRFWGRLSGFVSAMEKVWSERGVEKRWHVNVMRWKWKNVGWFCAPLILLVWVLK